jgi:hypothetical protein
MHSVVNEAKERDKAGVTPGSDTWRPNLEPRTAVRARTIPVLRKAKKEYEQKLAEVSIVGYNSKHDADCRMQMERENRELQAQILKNTREIKANEKTRDQMLSNLDEVWSCGLTRDSYGC